MGAFRILKPCSGAHDRFGLDVHSYVPGDIVSLPDHLARSWVAAGIAEAEPEATVEPSEAKPAAPTAYKDSKGETVSTVSVKRRPYQRRK